jgi:hypothetical protein
MRSNPRRLRHRQFENGWDRVAAPDCPRPGTLSHPTGNTSSMSPPPPSLAPPFGPPRALSRPCSWCHVPIPVAHRPGRPRLYCAARCRQRAYEHRHGFVHSRTQRPLPGQATADRWTGTGYERGGYAILASRAHALRPTARPQGHRRETLCGLLTAPLPGQHFNERYSKACIACVRLARAHPLRFGISPGSELARLRSVIVDVEERRLEPAEAMRWILATTPSDSSDVVVPRRMEHRLADAGPLASSA